MGGAFLSIAREGRGFLWGVFGLVLWGVLILLIEKVSGQAERKIGKGRYFWG